MNRIKYVNVFAIGIILLCVQHIVKSIEWLFGLKEGCLLGGIVYPGVITEEGVEKFFRTTMVHLWSGEVFTIDAVFTVAGYLIIAFAAWKCMVLSKRLRATSICAIVAAFSFVVFKTILFVLETPYVEPVFFGSLLVNIAFTGFMFYTLSAVLGNTVDTYKYMEVGKDMMFGFELIIFSIVVGNLLAPIRNLELFGVTYFILQICVVISIAYYVVKLLKYKSIFALGKFGTDKK